MRKLRGLIALFVALLMAGLAAYAVYNRLLEPKAQKKTKQEQQAAKSESPEQKALEAPPQLSRRIENGFRAVTLSLDTGVSGLHGIQPGDQVDVLAVSPAFDGKNGSLSRLLLAGIEVLDLPKGAEAGARNTRKQAVTLKVTPTEALKLAAADQAATLRLVLRDHRDRDISAQTPAAFLGEDGASAYLPRQLELESLITPGMRAITVDVSDTDGVGGVFRPGDRVDVVVTCPWGNFTLQAESSPGATGAVKETHRNAKIHFQNLKILSTNQSLHWREALNRPVSQVTLEVTPKQAEELTVLVDSKEGKNVLRLISRNRTDEHLPQTQGADLLDLLGGRVPHSTVRIYRGAMVKDQVFYRAL